MNKHEKISENEWLIMEILWRNGAVKSSTVSDELKDIKGWADPTIRTFLKRLIKKKVAAARQDENDKRIYWYYPILTKEECINNQTRGHLTKYYDGNISDMVVGLLKDENVTEQQLNEIEDMLKSLRNRNKEK